MDTLAKNYLNSQKESQAAALVRECRVQSLFHLGCAVGEFFAETFPFSRNILDEYGICLFYAGKNKESHKEFQKLVMLPNLDEKTLDHYLFNDHFNYDRLEGSFSDYDPAHISKIPYFRKPNPFPLFTFSITTCKRLDLFMRTMYSFLNCCEDYSLIDDWICVDDNSSEEDRKIMKEKYPFFTFIFKGEDEKGHARSMNLIRQKVKTPYLCHLEDDWEFFISRPYLTQALEVLSAEDKIKQCLFNRNYGEITGDINIKGGFKKSTGTGLNYYLHDRCASDQEFNEKYGPGRNCAYWPHFSFRPSVVETEIFGVLGEYDEGADHFEMNYAYRYFNKGYVSAFFPGIHCIHTGRLTSQRFDASKQNAYKLNQQAQFSKEVHSVSAEVGGVSFELLPSDVQALIGQMKANPEETLKNFLEFRSDKFKGAVELVSSETAGYLVNLENRRDRWEALQEEIEDFQHFKVERFNAVDGNRLQKNANLSRLFDGNDYNMRRGMVGCALSHLQIMIRFLETDKKYCLVLEDDITFADNFEGKLTWARSILPEDFGLLYLGYHSRDARAPFDAYPTVHSWTVEECLKDSLGGTFGYLISRLGCEEILSFIDDHGMTNGIDTMQQKAGSVTKLFHCEPSIVSSECWRGNNKVDSDIQFDYSSLTIPFGERLELEFSELTDICGGAISTYILEDALGFCKELNAPLIYDARQEGGLQKVLQEALDRHYFHYTIEGLAVVVCPHDAMALGLVSKHRGHTRLWWWVGVDQEYSVEKCISYESRTEELD